MIRFIVISLLFTFQAIADDDIGKIIALDGVVNAVRLQEATRVLQVDSLIYENDIITVNDNARAQIGFTDGSIVNLIPQTTYQILKYRYRFPFLKDHFVAKISRGGINSLSGSIAKKNPDGVLVETPTATLGIRGTIFQINVVGNNSFFGCSLGEISIQNKNGAQILGPAEQFTFARVPSQSNKIVLLSTRPPALETSLFVPPTRGLDLEKIAINPNLGPYPPSSRPSKSNAPALKTQAPPAPKTQTKTAPQAAPSIIETPSEGTGQPPAELSRPQKGSSVQSGSC